MRFQRLHLLLLALVVLLVMVVPKQIAAERQPHMRAALQALRVAERHLEQAALDKGGHRAKALALAREAIREVQKGIEFGTTH
jgi:hypothetical protein